MRARLAILAGTAALSALVSGGAEAGTCVERRVGGALDATAVVCVGEDGCIVYQDTGSNVHAGRELCVPGWCVVESPMYDVCVATAYCTVLVQPSMPPAICVP